MNPIVEISENGALYLPREILEAIEPNKRFVVEVNNKRLILYPEKEDKPFWATATLKERAERLIQWAESHKDGPNLPDAALSRENMYD
ncbi:MULTISPECIES: hypothetical protein [Aerosakkonema]|uniref:hypothetical protein n=1 Tax=Aerosakkonema TaxID=1246629 RepID=UPI0035B9183B